MLLMAVSTGDRLFRWRSAGKVVGYEAEKDESDDDGSGAKQPGSNSRGVMR